MSSGPALVAGAVGPVDLEAAAPDRHAAPARRQLASATLATALLKAGQLGLGLAGAVVLARALGPHGYGVYGLALAWVTVVALPAQLGLPTLLVREVARYHSRAQWAQLRGLLRWSNLAIFASAPLLAGALLGAAALLRDGAHGALAPVLACGALLVPLGALSAVRSGALRGMHRAVAGQAPELLVRPGALLVLVAAWLTWAGPLTPARAMAAQVLAAAIAWAVGALVLARTLPAPVRAAAPVFEQRRWFASLVPLSALGGVQLLSGQVDVLLLGALGAPAQVGLYRVATQGALLVSFGLIAVNMAIAPEIARLHAAGRGAALQRLLTRAARVAIGTALPVAALLWWRGDALLGALFGAPFTHAYAALAVLCAGQLVNACAGPVGMLLNMAGHERDTLRAVTLATLVGAGVSALAIPRFGALGAAAGNAAALVLWNVLLCIQARRRTGLRCVPWARALP